MATRNEKTYKRKRRHLRVRRKITGTPERPRLCVFRSGRNIYAQIIDDTNGHTLVAASSLKIGQLEAKDKKTGKKLNEAQAVGKAIAEAAKEKGVSKVAFDRGGYLYHGRVAALAKAARKAGLEF